ncbi:MAG: phosphoenolpyruvate--protein phosphotransferase [Aerococcus sp.]|nr:phosphoenolpyruvate--protein phosphotransferase [Aerococcus sp.]
MQTFKGIGASDGIAIAKAFLLEQPDLSVKITQSGEAAEEIDRLHAAIEQSRGEIQKIKAIASERLSAEEAEVFEAHLTMLGDPELLASYESAIKDDGLNAQSAVKKSADMFIQMFKAMEDNPYMQERAADIKDVTDRVIAHLIGAKIPNLGLIAEDAVVIANDLTPSDTAQLNDYVKGFVTDVGGRTSHSAIMARSLEIAAVVGTGEATTKIKDGDMIIVDGFSGDVIIAPDEATIAKYEAEAKNFAEQKREWEKLKDTQSQSKDGKIFTIGANIGSPKDLPGVHENGAEAVGLYRTEFLYMDSDVLPSEEDQFEAYKEVLESLDGKQVIIRTMDIGGDKQLPYLALPEEMNPFLGYRAIRVSLDQDHIFRTQLRALLRASAYGRLGIMFPMISNLTEFRQAKAILEEEREKLVNEGVTVGSDLEVGIMIEIPAAAILADQFAKEVDFFSIGTNDLIQYSMAADRLNERVSYLYQPYNPSVLRLIKFVIESSHKEGKWTGMCGEVAGDQTALPILVGMGLDEFSMSATSILKSRSLMAQLSTEDCKELARRAVEECQTSDEVAKMVEEFKANL